MKSVVILMACKVPTEVLIADLKSAITEWEINGSEDNREHLMFQLNLLTINLITCGKVEKAMQMMNDVNDMVTIRNAFTDNKN